MAVPWYESVSATARVLANVLWAPGMSLNIRSMLTRRLHNSTVRTVCLLEGECNRNGNGSCIFVPSSQVALATLESRVREPPRMSPIYTMHPILLFMCPAYST